MNKKKKLRKIESIAKHYAAGDVKRLQKAYGKDGVPPHLLQMVDETAAMYVRTAKLSTFIESEKETYGALPKVERKLLKSQLFHMAGYHRALSLRINEAVKRGLSSLQKKAAKKTVEKAAKKAVKK